MATKTTINDEFRYDVDAEEVIKSLEKFTSKRNSFIFAAISESMQVIGVTATGVFMKNEPGPHGDLIGKRTTRLSRSVQAAGYFGKISETGTLAGGDSDAIRKLSIQGSDFTATMGTKVPYAAIHEFGNRSGTIPARPYLSRALEAKEQFILDTFASKMEKLLEEIDAGQQPNIS